MREYGKVFCDIWASEDFRSLNEDGRALALYLLTCQHCTAVGAFRLPDGYATEDLQWTAERVSKGFVEVSRKGFATRDERSKWVVIHKFLVWNPIENPNQAKSAAKLLAQMPEGEAKSLLMKGFELSGKYLSTLGIEPLRKGSETLSQPGTGAVTGTEAEKEQERRALAESTAAACKAMVEGGIPPTRINQSHPELLALVADPRATPAMFRDTAAEGGGKPMQWVVATIAGRLADAARPSARKTAANNFARTEPQRFERGALSEGKTPSWLEESDVASV